MNSLRNIVEQINSGVILFDQHLSADDARFLAKSVADQAESFQCFWLGELANVAPITPIRQLARMPYPSVWFEGAYEPNEDGTSAKMGVAAKERPDGLVNMVGFMRFGGESNWAVAWVANDIDFSMCNDTGRWSVSTLAPEVVPFMNAAVYCIRAFCSALACSNVVKEQHDPEPALQKARERRGKKPLFSYWTLALTGRNPEGKSLGGTHASPRVHLRRGHARQFAPGRWTWVQACAVGNKALGLVHKDYAVSPKLLGKDQSSFATISSTSGL